MALKPKRLEDRYGFDLSYFMTSAAQRGGIVVNGSIGSGTAMDQPEATVSYAANPSGLVPVGILLNDVVVKDLSQDTLNPYKAETVVGAKVTVNRRGTYTTNMIYPGLTIAKDQTAFLGPSGLLVNVAVNAVANPRVGVFLSSKDADGYAKVNINLPN